jgi:TRAP transporter 4TM/12TM fusion protein
MADAQVLTEPESGPETPPARLMRHVGMALAVAMSVFAIYVAAIGVFDNVVVSGTTVLLAVTYCFAAWHGKGANYPLLIVHVFMLAVFCLLTWWWMQIMFTQQQLIISINDFQHLQAWIAVAMITYITWRYFGIPMVAVVVAAAIWVLLPREFGGAGEAWTRVAQNLWYSTDGVFGRPVEVVGRTVLIYVVLGAILQTAGAGEVLLRFAFAATGRLAGGPAHAAIVGSAMFGTMSGAAVANVVSTGVFTIPVIKKVGFSPRFAGGVEAAASTGGQIMPPVMGAVAFLMADLTGIPYLHIIIAAAIPAVMYYASLFVIVSLEAKRKGITAIPPEQRVRLQRSDVVKSIAFWVPLFVIVGVLMTGRTAQNAGVYAAGSAFLLSLVLFPQFRHPRKWLEALIDAGKAACTLMVVVAAIGFVIGVVNMTGIGLWFAEQVLSVSGETLGFALVMVMCASLLLGMGVPTGAAYLIIAIVLGPAISRLGVPLVAAHLFVLYYGVMSSVTPPVALSAFAAAPIAGAGPMETGWAAVKLASAGFIIPFVFVFHTDILLIVDGATVWGAAWAVLAFAFTTWGLGTGIVGWDAVNLPLWERPVRIAVGIGCLFTDWRIALAAAAILVALSLPRRIRSRSVAVDKNLGTHKGGTRL